MIREAAQYLPSAEVVWVPGNVSDFLIANTASQTAPVIARDAAEKIPEASAVLLNPKVADLRSALRNRDMDSRMDEKQDHAYLDRRLPILGGFKNVFFKDEVTIDVLRELC